jgi:hypothetical protein
MTRQHAWKLPWIVLSASMLLGCDQISERAGFPDPTKTEAEGKAIGGACRHAGRGLEDCYRLNKEATKSAVYAGWKEMNEYMVKNNMQAVEPTIPPEELTPPESKKKAKAKAEPDTEDESTKTDKPKKAAHDEDADTAAAKEH